MRVRLRTRSACLVVLSALSIPAASETSSAWSEFAKEIGAMGSLIADAPMSGSEQVRAEGYRHLARLLSSDLEKSLEGSDPDFPRLSRMPNSIARIGWDNPDNVYLSATIRGDHTYRIRGNLGSVNFISFNIYDGVVGKGMKRDVRSVASLDRGSLEADASGNFELILSPDPQPGNWLKLGKDAESLTIRQVFNDWAVERQASLELVNLTTQGTYPKPFDAETLARQLRQSVTRAAELRSFFNQNHSRLFSGERPVNAVSAPRIGGAGLGMGDPRNATSVGHFMIEQDEALILTVPVVRCAYTNIQVGNLWWESLDYTNHQSHLNGRMARPDADGKLRYVISRQDPGVPNWLDTVGHAEGTLFMRWTSCSDVPGRVESEVVKLGRLGSVLPRDTPVVSARDRLEAIDLRQSVVSRRLAGG